MGRKSAINKFLEMYLPAPKNTYEQEGTWLRCLKCKGRTRDAYKHENGEGCSSRYGALVVRTTEAQMKADGFSRLTFERCLHLVPEIEIRRGPGVSWRNGETEDRSFAPTWAVLLAGLKPASLKERLWLLKRAAARPELQAAIVAVTQLGGKDALADFIAKSVTRGDFDSVWQAKGPEEMNPQNLNLKLKFFNGKAEVLGKEHSVSFSDHGDGVEDCALTVHGLSTEEALLILNGLKLLNTEPVVQMMSAQNNHAVKSEPKEEKPEPKKEEKPAEVKATKKAEMKPVETASTTGGVSFEELGKCEKLRDVLVYLMEHGFDTKEKLVAFCNTNKDKVTVLKRVADIDGRVERTFELIAAE